MEAQQEQEIGEVFNGITYVTLKRARAISGMATATIDDRIRRAGIQLYRYPASHREKMITREDFGKLLEVIPA